MDRKEIIRLLTVISELKAGDSWPKELDPKGDGLSYAEPLSTLCRQAADLLAKEGAEICH